MLGWLPASLFWCWLASSSWKMKLPSQTPRPCWLTHCVCTNLSSKLLKNCTSVMFDVWVFVLTEQERMVHVSNEARNVTKEQKIRDMERYIQHWEICKEYSIYTLAPTRGSRQKAVHYPNSIPHGQSKHFPSIHSCKPPADLKKSAKAEKRIYTMCLHFSEGLKIWAIWTQLDLSS